MSTEPTDTNSTEERELPEPSKTRRALALAGVIPEIGGIFSLIASRWSEKEQQRVNEFFRAWMQMLQDELREKEATIIDIMARLDVTDETIVKRVESPEYQALLKKTFREWAGAESRDKRAYIRNILSNAAAASITSDDVVRLFLDWLKMFSEMHFHVIAVIYNSNGIGRREMWRRIGKEPVREDSAEADLFKLLIRDLSMGSIIRQHRETDYYGNFVKKAPKRTGKGYASSTMKSAFDEEELYELTELGQQFVHYAMTEIPTRIEYKDPFEK
jgi:hypothetical protein